MMCKFGSHLYGTQTPESDKDFKGIYLPNKEDIFLGRVKKSISCSTKEDHFNKNTKDDTEIEIYSLQYFIELACEGQTVALDMLHVPEEMIYFYTPNYPKDYYKIWEEIIENRSKFYTKNLDAFVGYARKQASKYGIKGSRLSDAKNVLDVLYEHGVHNQGYHKLSSIWKDLPEGEHIRKYVDEKSKLNMYEVCNRKIQETVTIGYAYLTVEKFYNSYGERAKKAQSNEGIDWKAISHALRAAYQVKEIFEDGTITFPLKEKEFIKDVKLGKLDYLTIVAPKLESLIDEVEALSKKSTLSKKVDREYWDNFLLKTIEDYVL